MHVSSGVNPALLHISIKCLYSKLLGSNSNIKRIVVRGRLIWYIGWLTNIFYGNNGWTTFSTELLMLDEVSFFDAKAAFRIATAIQERFAICYFSTTFCAEVLAKKICYLQSTFRAPLHQKCSFPNLIIYCHQRCILNYSTLVVPFNGLLDISLNNFFYAETALIYLFLHQLSAIAYPVT